MFKSSPQKDNCNSKNTKVQNQGDLPAQSSKIMTDFNAFGQTDLQKKIETNTTQDSIMQGENSEKSSFWSLKRKILVGVVIFVLVATGLTIGLVLGLRTEVNQIGKPTQISLNDGSTVVMAELDITKKHLFGENSKYKIFATQSIPSPITTTTRMLQEESSAPSNYYSTVNLEQMGFMLTVGSDQSFSMRLDTDALESYLLQSVPNARRLLQEINQTSTDNQTLTIESLQLQLSTMISEVLQIDGPVQFTDTLMVNLVLNQEKNSFEFETTNQTIINSRRRLLVRMLFLTKFFNTIKNVFTSIIKPVVYFLRENGELVGQALGGVIGGVVGGLLGGPAGFLQGMEQGFQIGGHLGLTLQTFLKVCVPENRFTFSCSLQDPKSVIGVISLLKMTPTKNFFASFGKMRF